MKATKWAYQLPHMNSFNNGAFLLANLAYEFAYKILAGRKVKPMDLERTIDAIRAAPWSETIFRIWGQQALVKPFKNAGAPKLRRRHIHR